MSKRHLPGWLVGAALCVAGDVGHRAVIEPAARAKAEEAGMSSERLERLHGFIRRSSTKARSPAP